MKYLLITALFLVVFVFATPAKAAPLTQSQVNAIITIMQSFGVDSATILNIKTTLSNSTSAKVESVVKTTFKGVPTYAQVKRELAKSRNKEVTYMENGCVYSINHLVSEHIFKTRDMSIRDLASGASC
ncbi:MAG TPA: hypothetical protein VHD55_00730 [Candidatus Paceibacterota bacterium]|nr:hypothetical protein [Candidatus Paceibacterota bacterium]